MSQYTRRHFLELGSAALAGFGLAPSSRLTSSDRPVAPSDQLHFGVIGCNGMGWANLNAHRALPGVECIALCDVDRNVLDERAAALEERSGEAPALYEDYRRLLEDDDVDFVIIATPDHWHCLQMVHACQAGKDVYVEKPLGRTIGECLVMQDAAAQTNRVIQVGQWQRSAPHWEAAIEYLRSGPLGTIRLVKTWAYQGWMKPIPVEPDEPVPDGVDYDRWLGPAPERPFNPNRFHFNWRWFWDYAGGLMTDWGVHIIDFGLYGMDVSTPNHVTSMGGPFGYPDDAEETPDTQQALYAFDDFTLIWEHAVGIDGGPYDRDHGVAFIGNNGTLVIDRNGWQVYPEVEDGEYKTDPLPIHEGGGGLQEHAKNFVECIRTRSTPNCPVHVAANTAINATMGNIAYQLERAVRWDPSTRRFVDDDEANDLVWPTYREPLSLPTL